MALATLSVDLIAKLASFEGDLGRAARASEQTAQRMTSAFGTVKTSIAGLAAGVTFGAIIGFAKELNRGVDALNDLKDATGSSIENISALEDVALRTGTSFETVSTALIKFNKVLGEAKPGSEAQAALKAIGLEAEALKKLDPAEALLRVATALQGFADDGNKARLAQELFGKSLKDVAPFLKDLADKGKLVATVTTEQAEQAERFNHALANLAKNSQDTARSILGSIIPALNKMLETFNSLNSAGLFGTALKDKFKELVGLNRLTSDPLADTNKLLAERAKLEKDYAATLAYEEKFKGRNREASEQIKAEIDATNKLIAVAKLRQSTDPVAGAGRGFVNPALPKPSVDFQGAAKKQGAEAASAYEALNRRVQENIDLLGKELQLGRTLSEEEKFSQKILSDAAASKVALSQAEGKALQANLDKYKQLTGAAQLQRATIDLANKALDRQNEAEVAAAKQAEDIVAAAAKADFDAFARFKQKISDIEFETSLLGKSNADRELAIQQRELEASAIDKTTESYAKLRDGLRGSVQRNEEQKASLEKLNKTLDENASRFKELAGALTDSFFRGGDAFGKWVDKQIEEAFRLKVIEPILKQVFGGISTSTPGGETGIPSPVDLLGKLFSFDGGGHTGTGARTGGLDGKGGFLAMLHPQERVTDLTRHNNAGGGGATTIIQNFTVGDVPSKQFVQDAVRSGIGRAEFARRDFAGRQF